jgi:hypothetical protein
MRSDCSRLLENAGSHPRTPTPSLDVHSLAACRRESRPTPAYRTGSRLASGMSDFGVAILCLFAAFIGSPKCLDRSQNFLIVGIRASAVHYSSLAVLTDQSSSHRNSVYSNPAADDATVRPLRTLFQRNQSLSSWAAGNAGQYHEYGSRPDTVTTGLGNRLLRLVGCSTRRCDRRTASPAHACPASSLASEILMSANAQ